MCGKVLMIFAAPLGTQPMGSISHPTAHVSTCVCTRSYGKHGSPYVNAPPAPSIFALSKAQEPSPFPHRELVDAASASQRATNSHVTMILFLTVLVLWEEGRNRSWDAFPQRCSGIRVFSLLFRGKESKFLSTFLHRQTSVGGCDAKVRFVIPGTLPRSRVGKYPSALLPSLPLGLPGAGHWEAGLPRKRLASASGSASTHRGQGTETTMCRQEDARCIPAMVQPGAANPVPFAASSPLPDLAPRQHTSLELGLEHPPWAPSVPFAQGWGELWGAPCILGERHISNWQRVPMAPACASSLSLEVQHLMSSSEACIRQVITSQCGPSRGSDGDTGWHHAAVTWVLRAHQTSPGQDLTMGLLGGALAASAPAQEAVEQGCSAGRSAPVLGERCFPAVSRREQGSPLSEGCSASPICP